ncbi:histone-like nucleoid-structuring protein Lsr2 [Streptomyces kronopolitis]
MAQKIQIRLQDDLDGSEAEETVSFALDGKHRQIELSRENAATFRSLLQPYMEASRPASPDSIASKGTLAPGPAATSLPAEIDPDTPLPQSVRRQEGAAIRAWANEHQLPLNPLGRIPERTREAWKHHTRKNDRTLLNELLKEAGIDPATASKPKPRNVVSITTGKLSVEEHLERQARAVGKLSEPQEERLRSACNGDGTATATSHADRSSYVALARRGCMALAAADTYVVTDVGRTWVRLNQSALSA